MTHRNEAIKQVMRDTLQACEKPDNAFDDQELFWKIVHAQEKVNPFMRHCDAKQVDAVTTGKLMPGSTSTTHTGGDENKQKRTRLCCLDTYDYPVGDTTPPNPNILTFHANYVFGKKKKIKKLRGVRSADRISGWNSSRIDSSLSKK
jgi:hypothetical protein